MSHRASFRYLWRQTIRDVKLFLASTRLMQIVEIEASVRDIKHVSTKCTEILALFSTVYFLFRLTRQKIDLPLCNS